MGWSGSGLKFRRLAAVVVDMLVCLVLMVPALAGMIVFMAGGDPELAGALASVGYVGGVILLAGYWLFRDAFHSLGKRIFGLEVVGAGTGLPCSWWRSLVRNAVMWLLVLVLIGILVEPLLVLLHPKGQRLGDLLAGTVVKEYGGV